MDIDQTLVTHTSPARRSFLGIKFAQDKHSTLRGKKSKGLIRRWQQDESSSGGSSNGNSSSEGDSDDTLATKEPREVERSTICDAASEQLPGYAGQDINCALLPPESASHQQAWMGSNMTGAASAKPTATAAGTHQTAHAKDKHRVHSDATYEGTGALSGILAPPPPSAHEQQKMDAWAADDDDVSNYEYDVSGAFFDMPSLPKVAGRDVGDRYALAAKVSGNRGSAKQQEQYPWHRRGRGRSSEGSSTASRLSSSSTVIESDELTAEQYKRIFVASARKLRWQKPRRGILGLMHIRNTMAHANAQFMECMGGERLDKYQQEIVSLNDMYTNEVSVPSANRRNGLYTPRSAGAQWRVHNAVPPSRPRKMPASQDQRAGTSSESGAGVDQSPIADSELLGFGSGDLVSLVPVRVGGQAPMYRPRRRRGAARRANYLMALPAIPVQ
ncbi:hypothetical protein FBU59_001068 [Linderina macrospora]|uniref:Uncharacterized protein n=1 Tax=Linderina macrospora TaxID=4868 RepID=A0ACC1JF00_9FUNG|nr:hypothetical protein FBU59_001068 [Linderina macrospora]